MFYPPESVKDNFRKGLALLKSGRGGKGLVKRTITEAKAISSGRPISYDKAKRMNAWFARHYVDKRPGWDRTNQETPGYVAHMLWGGDKAREWVKKMMKTNPPISLIKMKNPLNPSKNEYIQRLRELIKQAEYEGSMSPQLTDDDLKNETQRFRDAMRLSDEFTNLEEAAEKEHGKRFAGHLRGLQMDYVIAPIFGDKPKLLMDNPLNTRAHQFISTRLKEMARRGDFDKVPKEKRFLAAQQAMKEAWNIARARGLTKHNPVLLRRTWRTIGAALVALVALKLLQR